jgi:hypothetical protein
MIVLPFVPNRKRLAILAVVGAIIALVKDTAEQQGVDRCEQVHVTAISQVAEWCHVGVMRIVMNGGK